MKKLFFTAFLALVALAATAGEFRPKLIVGIAVDQMRWDYLYRYYDEYGEGGFKRLMNQGYNCENTMINYVPAITAVGHTSLFTGTTPAIHGIVGNNFPIHGKMSYCCQDNSVTTVGSDTKAGQMSPRNMLTTTIGDELKVATNFKSKVIGVAIKDRAAILPAGHSADAAYWIDGKNSRFITSTYYMNELPEWVKDFNKSIEKYTDDEVSFSPIGNLVTAEMAKAAIANEKLGQRGETDMLTISFSSTDKIGHKWGTHCQKIHDQFVDLDQRLADLMTYLDNTVGKGEYLLFLSADHGAANNILMNQEHKIPADGFFYKNEIADLNAYLQKKYSTKLKLALYCLSYQIFLDHNAVRKADQELDDVRADVAEYFLKKDYIQYAVDVDKVAESTMPLFIKEKIQNGYYHHRSGDVQLIINPAWYEIYGEKIDTGTTHGAWNPYDAHIPFLMMGWGVKPGKTNAKTYIVDIAPTICTLVHIQMPNGCIGNAVEMK